ncbi:preprotein translocase subunit SecE [Temperatibacter marinus]|uniref:Protein translocase subunit SecE n=1 Tax=Temperatibacter marinus TaxID=1456591 RepID=A0AA52EDJ6_9PROT|nr:preprotein translocase subunit SecE [Temperatibacter marinus]WND02806.1 preprotein translocase subunit SecE [Temperatibacter marinus]
MAEGKKTSPGEFVRQVRQEGSKVAWPSAKQTNTSSVMVFIMVVIMASFFVLIDTILGSAVSALLGF